MAFDPFPRGLRALVTTETIWTNARVVLEDRILDGTLVIQDGRIAAIEPGRSRQPAATDLGGDYLIPGLVDLHTDNLEKHFQPRRGVTWDPVAAAIAHDGQIAAAGITTVFDSLTIGAADGWDMRAEMVEPMLDGLDEARRHAMLRIDHRLHLRCEVTHPAIAAVYDSHAARHAVHMLSLMDHAPGDRQMPDLEGYRARSLALFDGDAVALDAHIDQLVTASRELGPVNRRALAERARAAGIPLATHDDASPAHIEDAVAMGAVFTEFPTTLAAARTARERGLPTLMGTPNLMRGGSHSGNVAAGDLVAQGLLDLLASDYIPLSLLKGAFRLTEAPYELDLAAAIGMVTSRPADVAGLTDRGRIAVGLRADLVRVQPIRGRPIVREVLVEGRRVA